MTNRQRSIYLSDELWALVERKAQHEDRSAAAVIRTILRNYLGDERRTTRITPNLPDNDQVNSTRN